MAFQKRHDTLNDFTRVKHSSLDRLGRQLVKNRRKLLQNQRRCAGLQSEDAQWILQTWPAARSLPILRERSWLRTLSIDGLMREIGTLQKNDIRYWSPIIDELRDMRRNRLLIAEGTRI